MKMVYFFLFGTIFCVTSLNAMELTSEYKKQLFIERLRQESKDWAKRLAHKKFSTPVHNKMLAEITAADTSNLPDQPNKEHRKIEVETLNQLETTNQRALTAALYLEISKKPKIKGM